MGDLLSRIKEAYDFLHKRISLKPQVGIILGSGFDSFGDALRKKEEINYGAIPYFHQCSVDGHRGELLAGLIDGVPVILLRGRPHLYEGLSAEDVVFPVRVLAYLGIECLILTNAAGGINKTFSTGSLVMIDDHINLTGTNPLIGPNDDRIGPRFVDLGETYDTGLKTLMKQSAKELNYPLKSGVYVGVTGPHYETPAETKMMRILGGDMVGMSTVFESIAARHLGLKVAGLSCIANEASQGGETTLSHEDVKDQVLLSKESVHALLQRIVVNIGRANVK